MAMWGLGSYINPDVLVTGLREAGVKRSVIDSPAFVEVPRTSVAHLGQVSVMFGGLEGA